jgi:hypothetical protein
MNKRMRNKNKKALRFLIIILLLCGVLFLSYKLFLKNNDNITNVIDVVTDHKENIPHVDKISLLATGDTVMHNDVVKYGLLDDGTYNYNGYLTEVSDIVKQYDIAYYNQETILGGASLGYSYYPMFNSPTEWGDAMVNAGFNTVSLASNHAFDKHEQGVINSVTYWKSKNVTYNGQAISQEERDIIPIVTKNNITYAFLSYTYGTNGINVPSNESYMVNVYSDEQAKLDIDKVKDKVDVIIVAMHWGTEYMQTPTDEQVREAQYLADLGVNIIIGNHPHSLQPITWLNNNNTLVIYSLGNFISNQGILYSTIGYKGVIGAFATLNIDKTTFNGESKISLDNLEVELLYTYKNSQQRYYKIIPFSKMNNNYLNNYQSVYETYKNVIQKYNQNIVVKPCA